MEEDNSCEYQVPPVNEQENNGETSDFDEVESINTDDEDDEEALSEEEDANSSDDLSDDDTEELDAMSDDEDPSLDQSIDVLRNNDMYSSCLKRKQEHLSRNVIILGSKPNKESSCFFIDRRTSSDYGSSNEAHFENNNKTITSTYVDDVVNRINSNNKISQICYKETDELKTNKTYHVKSASNDKNNEREDLKSFSKCFSRNSSKESVGNKTHECETQNVGISKQKNTSEYCLHCKRQFFDKEMFVEHLTEVAIEISAKKQEYVNNLKKDCYSLLQKTCNECHPKSCNDKKKKGKDISDLISNLNASKCSTKNTAKYAEIKSTITNTHLGKCVNNNETSLNNIISSNAINTAKPIKTFNRHSATSNFNIKLKFKLKDKDTKEYEVSNMEDQHETSSDTTQLCVQGRDLLTQNNYDNENNVHILEDAAKAWKSKDTENDRKKIENNNITITSKGMSRTNDIDIQDKIYFHREYLNHPVKISLQSVGTTNALINNTEQHDLTNIDTLQYCDNSTLKTVGYISNQRNIAVDKVKENELDTTEIFVKKCIKKTNCVISNHIDTVSNDNEDNNITKTKDDTAKTNLNCRPDNMNARDVHKLEPYTKELKNENPTLFKCQKCNTHFFKRIEILTHVKNFKNMCNVKARLCEICGLIFNEKSIDMHRKKHHLHKNYNQVLIIEYVFDENETYTITMRVCDLNKDVREPIRDTNSSSLLLFEDDGNMSMESSSSRIISEKFINTIYDGDSQVTNTVKREFETANSENIFEKPSKRLKFEDNDFYKGF